jgi:hypothetical protein
MCIYQALLPENTYEDKEVEKTFVELAKPMYSTKVWWGGGVADFAGGS